MLAVSPLMNTRNAESNGEMESFNIISSEEFPDFADGNLLESIDFDDLFVGLDEGDALPDLEMDSEILAEVPASRREVEESSDMNTSVEKTNEDSNQRRDEEEQDKVSGSGSGSGSGSSSSSSKGEEILSKREEPNTVNKRSPKHGVKGRKASAEGKNTKQEKRKTKKVDWTPELHRRFVQAVEQLGVDKAVPSKILELMGIDCLTRHNIASHLQKYRSHRKNLLAREAEAASWSHRRQMYGATTPVGGGKRDVNPWVAVAPTMGFLPVSPMHHHHFKPLHVWGHPTMDQSHMNLWPKHPGHTPSPPPLPPPQSTWGPPPANLSFWHHHHKRVSNGVTPGTPWFLQPMAPTRFGAAPVPGIPPHHHGTGGQPGPHLLVDYHPSKESIDATIGEILSKPWLPLPLGLKPPSTDSVLGELQRQGVPNIPPSCA